ncbi:hypothetical protein SBRCBS47491_003695 [Sporothrix bragantina]|uniref:Zn(2)-C6 fungal-type domain-containing protein n=1 Tax=Sporothrix bragantina TaxID=671064 RepID=A0ABP0BH91_9PEZI
MAYMRKRAAVACNYCRHRKRRCDAKTPVCSLCAESGVACVYPDAPNDVRSTSRPIESDLQPLLSRIAKLEAQVQQQAETMAHWNSNNTSHRPGSSTVPASAVMTVTASPRPPSSDYLHVPGLETYDAHDAHDVSLIIPVGHWTTTGNLLSLPQIRNLLGTYPPNFFLQLESARANAVHSHVCQGQPATIPELPVLHASETDALVDAFFAYVYPLFPVLDRDMFAPLYKTVLTRGLRADPASALCLMLLALGQMALLDREDYDVGTHTGEELRGIDYFAPAYRIATAEWGFCYETDYVLPLALIHGALYLQYMNLPLQAWRMVHLTSINLQYAVASSRGGGARELAHIEDDSTASHTATTSTRLYWACFIFESDTLAEFHVPRTGIELVVDKLQFPTLSISSGRDALLFLAVCSIRRLLNRIHSTLYSTVLSTTAATAADATAPSPASALSPGSASQHTTTGTAASSTAHLHLPRVAEARFDSVCTELVRQLKTWYASLPDEIRPTLDNRVPRDLRDGWLRLRYWSAMHIIGRPSVLYIVLAEMDSPLPPHVMEYCKLCLDSSRSIIVVSSHILAQRTPYTWMILHALLAHVLMVSLAAMTPALQPLVPDTAALLGQVAAAVKPWATPDSSAEMIAWFVQVVRQKLRLSAINRLE